MLYQNVSVETFASQLPPHQLTSLKVEEMLAPAYSRLNFSPGRLELFTGIKERRYWDLTAVPSAVAAEAGAKAMQQAGLLPEDIDAVIHCSVCRDFLEPATASVVHQILKLPAHCVNFDISNACLGLISGMSVLADMVSSGRIRRGLVVSGEIGYPLLRRTVAHLNNDPTIKRQDFKLHFASLTIGSCAAAAIVSRSDIAKPGSHRLVSITDHADTSQNHLCRGSADSGMGGDSGPLMLTDSETLLHRGIAAASAAWPRFLAENGGRSFDRVVTHQVGTAHTALLFKNLGLDPSLDHPTFPFLGNCGSASLPATAALATQAGHLKPGHRVALLGIGSGINVGLAALEW